MVSDLWGSTRVVCDNEIVSAERVLSLRQAGDFDAIPSTGKVFEVQRSAVDEISDGIIHPDYWSSAATIGGPLDETPQA
jgi:predicted ester cyclase